MVAQLALSFIAISALPTAPASAPDAMHLHGLRLGEDAVKSGDNLMYLHLLKDTANTGAVCLDGTPGGFYFSPATDPAHKDDWQIYFQGGGWCYDEVDCWSRSFTELGSSYAWSPTGSMGGMLSSDCDKNPDFCSFNRVWMVYCDGNSFSGNRDAPVLVKGLDGGVKPLYFRGRRIIDETLKYLTAEFNLGSAKKVLLTGCSAGGLAVYLHTDYVHSRLRSLAPGMTKFKAASISGFFLQHANLDGKPVYPTQMESIFRLANSTHGLNEACIRAQPAGKEWQCNFAEHSYAHTTSDIFPLNSALDSWQAKCIFFSKLAPGFPSQSTKDNGVCGRGPPHWNGCISDPENCDAAQVDALNSYNHDFSATISALATYSRPGNGAFVHSCYTHCEAQGDDFFTFAINGTTMQQAVSRWWNSDGNEPAQKHTYAPCLFQTSNQSAAWQCNPTC